MISYGICLCLSDLLHLVWQSPVDPRCYKWHYFFFFLWLSSIPSCIYVYVCTHHFFIHSFADGHLDCFFVLAIVNVLLWTYYNIGVIIHIFSYVCVYTTYKKLTILTYKWISMCVYIHIYIYIYILSIHMTYIPWKTHVNWLLGLLYICGHMF